MAIIEQKKLFTLIETWEDIKNMGMVISCNSQHINPDYKYFIKLNKNILQHVTTDKILDIIKKTFIGAYGGSYSLDIFTDCIYIQAWEYND